MSCWSSFDTLRGLLLRYLVVGCEDVGVARIEPGDAGVAWVSGPGGLVKESDYTEKLRHTLFGKVLWVFSLGHVCGRDLVLKSFRVVVVLVQRGGACINVMGFMVLGSTKLGVAGDFQWNVQAHADVECPYTRIMQSPEQQ